MYNEAQVQRYILSKRPQGVIIDTNILLLLLIGNYKADFIKNCSLFKDSGQNYTIDDFELLKRLINYFSNKLIITPQILAEISNLSITNNKGEFKNEAMIYLQSVVNLLKKVEERHQQAECLWGMQLEVLGRFGFTDMTIYELAKGSGMPVLTDEFDLHIYLEKEGIPNIKFQNIKNSQLGFTSIP